ncbi:MAG: RAMP superfamily CRISPR-associated protein [Candidatus Baldrarchaeia archaeon]
MKIYEATLTFETMAIPYGERRREGYVLRRRDIILGSTIRGALITALMSKLGHEIIESELKEPGILSTPFFPLIDGKVKTYPAEAFTFEHKIPKKINGKEIREIVKMLDINALKKAARDNNIEIIAEKCIPDDPLFTPAVGKPIAKINNQYIAAEVKATRTIAVGISKRSGRSEEGMLFTYEAIAEGQSFWGRIIDLKDVISEALPKSNVIEVRIGRGASRGFGIAKLALKELSKGEITKRKEEIRKKISDGYVVLKAVAPLAVIGKNMFLETFPEQFTFDNQWTDYILSFDDVREFLDEKLRECKIELCSASGKKLTFGYLMEIGGWSLKSNLPKPVIRSSGPGSVAVYRITAGLDAAPDALLLAEVFGIDELSIAGFNYIEVIG